MRLRREDPDLDSAPFEFLLDGALNWVRCAQPFPVKFRQGEDREAFGDVFLEPIGLIGRGVAIAVCRCRRGGIGSAAMSRRPERRVGQRAGRYGRWKRRIRTRAARG